MSLTDAIGQQITRGWAIQCDARRGASSITKVYVLGTKGNKALVLGRGTSWNNPKLDEIPHMLEEYDRGNKEVPTYTKVTTRIVMLKEQDND